eukprot:m.61883 g.61883  ORF g.61883 m.61883 type:complete len:320 (+) comp13754_c0_seq2:245-1204(+)
MYVRKCMLCMHVCVWMSICITRTHTQQANSPSTASLTACLAGASECICFLSVLLHLLHLDVVLLHDKVALVAADDAAGKEDAVPVEHDDSDHGKGHGGLPVDEGGHVAGGLAGDALFAQLIALNEAHPRQHRVDQAAGQANPLLDDGIVVLLLQRGHPALLDAHEHDIVDAAGQAACVERAVGQKVARELHVGCGHAEEHHEDVVHPVDQRQRTVESDVVEVQSGDHNNAGSVRRAARRVGGVHVCVNDVRKVEDDDGKVDDDVQGKVHQVVSLCGKAAPAERELQQPEGPERRHEEVGIVGEVGILSHGGGAGCAQTQ